MILATGARLRTLGVEGEERLQGRGVSHCASCDAPLMRDRTVGVVGGGDSALQEALTLAEAVGEVIVLHRGDALTAQAAYREPALAHPKISVRYGTVVEEILGEDAVSGVRMRDVASGDDAEELELGGLFVYVGLAPNSEYLRDQLELDDDGRVPTDGALQTPLAGVFAAGIVRRGSLGQAAISAGEGAAAAKAAHRHLDEDSEGERQSDAGDCGRARATEAHMAEKLTVHDPRGYPPQVTGKPLAPRACRASRARRSISSTACSTTPRPSSTSCTPGSPSTCRACGIKRIAPRESWVDDPEMCAAIQADGDAAILAVGL